MDPSLLHYKAALQLYEREAGPCPERYTILDFRKHVAFCQLKKIKKNQLILTLSLTLGHYSVHYYQVFSIYFLSRLCILQNFNTNLPKIRSQKQTHLSSSKHGSVHTLYHMIIQDLETLHAIYGKWAMAPSCMTKRLLLPLLQFSHSECLGLKEGEVNRVIRKSRGGAAGRRGTWWRKLR